MFIWTTVQSRIRRFRINSAFAGADSWLDELKLGVSRQRKAEFIRWVRRSPSHLEQFLIAQEIRNLVKDLVNVKPIDIAALIEESKLERKRSVQIRNWIVTLVAIGVVLFLLLDRV